MPNNAIPCYTAVVKDGKIVEQFVRTINPYNCKFLILVADHYRDDGTCKCDDPAERARMIAEWEYTEEDFNGN